MDRKQQVCDQFILRSVERIVSVNLQGGSIVGQESASGKPFAIHPVEYGWNPVVGSDETVSGVFAIRHIVDLDSTAEFNGVLPENAGVITERVIIPVRIPIADSNGLLCTAGNAVFS